MTLVVYNFKNRGQGHKINKTDPLTHYYVGQIRTGYFAKGTDKKYRDKWEREKILQHES